MDVLSPAQQELLEYLQAVIAVIDLNDAETAAREEGWRYPSVHHLLLAEGRFFEPVSRPAGIRQLPERLCYNNAAATATGSAGSLFYVEGVAISDVFPLAHAWCANEAGEAVDPTWPEGSMRACFGIPFTRPGSWEHDGGGFLSDPSLFVGILRDGLPPLPGRNVGRRPSSAALAGQPAASC
ncbi:hypothetical protein ACFWXO_13700 [Kitasatospora sp. NPDC059088]|uniref:hypothetical protein n=1 Tax=Kitasatospora sp. NPDC059088 TaxID=3346722 RepID=UPI0036A43EC7